MKAMALGGAVAVTAAGLALNPADAILAFAYGSRRALAERRAVAQVVARYGKTAFGTALLIVGVLILTWLDRQLEALVLEAMPGWLVRFTTRF